MITLFTKDDYPKLIEWWKMHNWTPPAYDMLPKIGFIIDGYCAGFLYQTDSKVALLEFIIANPNSDKEKRSGCLDELINVLLSTAQEMGYTRVFSSIQHPKLIERYNKHGFLQTDTNMTNFIKVL